MIVAAISERRTTALKVSSQSAMRMSLLLRCERSKAKSRLRQIKASAIITKGKAIELGMVRLTQKPKWNCVAVMAKKKPSCRCADSDTLPRAFLASFAEAKHACAKKAAAAALAAQGRDERRLGHRPTSEPLQRPGTAAEEGRRPLRVRVGLRTSEVPHRERLGGRIAPAQRD